MVSKMRPLIFRPRLVAGNGPAPGDPAPGAGHTHAFRTAILPHLDGAYNLACYLTRDPLLSEDVVQDAFLRAFRAFADYRGGSARAWLFAIVRNCSRSALAARRASSLRTVSDDALSDGDAVAFADVADGQAGPEAALIRQREIDAVRASIHALPEPFREALILRDMEELSYREIAEVTEVALGTVMSRLARGRAMLVDLLLPRLADEPAKEAK